MLSFAATGDVVEDLQRAMAIGGVGLAAGIGLIATTAVRRRRRAAAAPPATEHAGLAGLQG